MSTTIGTKVRGGLGIFAAIAIGFLAATAGIARAQGAAQPTPPLIAHLKAMQTRIGPEIGHLSFGAQNLFHLVKVWDRFGAGAATIGRQYQAQPVSPVPAIRAAGKPISQPNLGVTRLSGFTQSETSVAWCGLNAVVAFNDSASTVSSLPGFAADVSGLSYIGYSVSHNGGRTFTYMHSPRVPTDVGAVQAGDPVVVCRNAGNFVYANLYDVADNCSNTGTLDTCNSGVAVMFSTDGGNTFGAPVEAVRKDGNTHLLDKDWLAIDQGNPSKLYLSYTDYDVTEDGSNGCRVDYDRTAIEIVSSTDGGTTWSTPVVVDQQCTPKNNGIAPFDEGSQVAVDPSTGTVYVAWEFYHSDYVTREIDVASSIDGGATFTGPIKAAEVHPAGDGGILVGFQGNIRNSEFPSLAIGKGKNDAGDLYLVWNDGDRPVSDLLVAAAYVGLPAGIGTQNTYNFADIFFIKSTDGGQTWTAPVQVNNSKGAARGATNFDAFRPVVASDKTGRVAVCFYDRRRDPNNSMRDRFCASSRNGGASWVNNKVTRHNSPSLTDQDVLLANGYDGDYDGLASDATNARAGFLDGYSDNSGGAPTAAVNKY